MIDIHQSKSFFSGYSMWNAVLPVTTIRPCSSRTFGPQCLGASNYDVCRVSDAELMVDWAAAAIETRTHLWWCRSGRRRSMGGRSDR